MYPRFLTASKIAGAVVVLSIAFLLGFWLAPPHFPISRKFVAVSLNGEPLISTRLGAKPLALEVRRFSPPSLLLCAVGNGPCNWFDAEVLFLPPNLVVWRKTYFTAVACREELEALYFHALLGTNRWRIEGGTLILYNGTDTLRFLLAPA